MAAENFPGGFEAMRSRHGPQAAAVAPYPPTAAAMAWGPGPWQGGASASACSSAAPGSAATGPLPPFLGCPPGMPMPMPAWGAQGPPAVPGGMPAVGGFGPAASPAPWPAAGQPLDWPELAGSRSHFQAPGAPASGAPAQPPGREPRPQDGAAAAGREEAPAGAQRAGEQPASSSAGNSGPAGGAPGQMGGGAMCHAVGQMPDMFQQMAAAGMASNPMAAAAGQMHAAALQQAMQMGAMWPGAVGGVGLADPWLSMYGMTGGGAGLSALAALPLTGGRQIVPAPKKRADPRRGAPAGARSRLPSLTAQEAADRQALIKAAGQRDEARCRALLLHPDFAGVDEKDPDGRTVLHVATLRKLPEDLCIEVLKHPGFKDVNAVDRWGNTILTLAASNSLANLCLALLEREEFNAVNVKDKWGATALHWAADRDLGPVCSSILAHPAFVEAHTVAFSFCFENRTALQRAEEKGCNDAAEAIRSHLNGTAPAKR